MYLNYSIEYIAQTNRKTNDNLKYSFTYVLLNPLIYNHFAWVFLLRRLFFDFSYGLRISCVMSQLANPYQP